MSRERFPWPDRFRRQAGGDPSGESFALTRFVFLRLFGLIYLLAFASASQQLLPLVGAKGLLPAVSFLESVKGALGTPDAYLQVPTLFWLGVSDGALLAVSWIGVALSAAVVAGYANAIMMALLWALYLSIDHVGQLFYGYGWELIILESGFLAIFLCPVLDPRPFQRRVPSAPLLMFLYRWVLFRVMLGAGLIKIRGDGCWRDLTCLIHHYETQPVPGPLSRFFHELPHSMNMAGVAFTHVVELVVPWFYLMPRRFREAAGILTILFQLTLIASGNLSWLNWLTLAITIPCFGDRTLARVLPARLVAAAGRASAGAARVGGARLSVLAGLAAAIAFLSLGPVANMVSPHQAMNRSFSRFELVNSYGAFGSVGRERYEIVFEGAEDSVWKEYEFKCKPGDVMRRPCVMSPYHYRIDWQIWFAAMADYTRYPWVVHFVWKLLQGDEATLSLLAGNPFPKGPPKQVRARLYRYEFADSGDPSGAWWKRTLVGEYLPPLSAGSPSLREFLSSRGW